MRLKEDTYGKSFFETQFRVELNRRAHSINIEIYHNDFKIDGVNHE